MFERLRSLESECCSDSNRVSSFAPSVVLQKGILTDSRAVTELVPKFFGRASVDSINFKPSHYFSNRLSCVDYDKADSARESSPPKFHSLITAKDGFGVLGAN